MTAPGMALVLALALACSRSPTGVAGADLVLLRFPDDLRTERRGRTLTEQTQTTSPTIINRGSVSVG